MYGLLFRVDSKNIWCLLLDAHNASTFFFFPSTPSHGLIYYPIRIPGYLPLGINISISKEQRGFKIVDFLDARFSVAFVINRKQVPVLRPGKDGGCGDVRFGTAVLIR